MNARAILEEKAKQYPQKSAIVYNDLVITFGQLCQNVSRLAWGLKELGLQKSDKLAIYLPNSPEYIYSYLACFYLGACCVPLDYMLKQDELVSCLNHAEVKILIAQPKEEVSLSHLKTTTPSLKRIVLTSFKNNDPLGYAGFSDLMKETNPPLPSYDIQDKDPALIMYTSGTTGRPKGILLNYKHLEGSPRAMQYFVDLSDTDVKLCAIPLSHIGGFIYIQNCIVFGITLILMERFNPYEFCKNISKYKVTCFHIVPAMYTALLSLKQIDQFDLSSLRWVVVFGAPSSPEILERFHQYCPNAKLLNGWGMTETCPPNTVTPLTSQNIESVGKPSPLCEIKIVDEADKDVSVGEVGEIKIRGWIVMEGYYKDPEATNEAIRNGWLYTGDLGRFDKEGFLYIVGRKKEMIKVGGQIVYASEVEAAFYKHEAVSEVAVVGMSDKLRGEVVKAFVVLKQGSNTSVEDLRYFAREHLANFKVPQTIELRDTLPKNRTGKIDKEALPMKGAE